MEGPEPDVPPMTAISAEELVRRRRNASRLAWLLAAIVLALYVGGLFVKR